MKNRPTNEQKKEFWERYGIVFTEDKAGIVASFNEIVVFYGILPLTMNNLFRYAVDWDEIDTIQFSYDGKGCHSWLYMKKLIGKPFHGSGETEALALFWAICSTIQGGKLRSYIPRVGEV